MTWISDDQYDKRHVGKQAGQVESASGRLGAWPELPSPDLATNNCKWNGPTVTRVLATLGAGPGRHHTHLEEKGADMAQRTRTLRRSDRVAGSGVKITPPWSTADTTTSL